MEIDGYIIKYLRRLTKPFAKFLSRYIPKLDRENWWTENVISVFSRSSKKDKERISEYTKLEDFDISDLFKILFGNWYELNYMFRNQNFHLFMHQNRKIFKQMLDIRIDLAHQKLLPISNNGEAFKYLDFIRRKPIRFNTPPLCGG
jgi:hypothetical protein